MNLSKLDSFQQSMLKKHFSQYPKGILTPSTSHQSLCFTHLVYQLGIIKTNKAFCNPHHMKLWWGLIRFTYKNMRCVPILQEKSPEHLLIVSCQHPPVFTSSIRQTCIKLLFELDRRDFNSIQGNHYETIGQLWTSLSLIRMSQSPPRLSDWSCAPDTDTQREREGRNNLWPCMLMRPSVASGSLMKQGWTSPLSALLSDTSA